MRTIRRWRSENLPHCSCHFGLSKRGDESRQVTGQHCGGVPRQPEWRRGQVLRKGVMTLRMMLWSRLIFSLSFWSSRVELISLYPWFLSVTCSNYLVSVCDFVSNMSPFTCDSSVHLTFLFSPSPEKVVSEAWTAVCGLQSRIVKDLKATGGQSDKACGCQVGGVCGWWRWLW